MRFYGRAVPKEVEEAEAKVELGLNTWADSILDIINVSHGND
jgi:hypothetical protein